MCFWNSFIRILSIAIFFITLCGNVFGLTNTALVEPIKLGNPTLAQYPVNNPQYAFARSVWDMHYYNGSIHIASGDLFQNQGPVDVWAFGTDGIFKKEYTVDEEQICLFRDYDGKLFIPGSDARESWGYGNLYIEDDSGWKKLRTIPNGIHVWDVVFFYGKIYVNIESNDGVEVHESCDMGQTWKCVLKRYYSDNIRFLQMVPMDSFLLIMAIKNEKTLFAYKYADGKVEELLIPLSGSLSPTNIYHLSRFKDSILYIACNASKRQLFFLNDFQNKAMLVKDFQNDDVRDIITRNDECYILVRSSSGQSSKGFIYSSSDLNTWTEIAEFCVPAPPCSFEYMDGFFYVGLGDCWGSNPNTWSNIESGSIYKIQPNNISSLAGNSHSGKKAPGIITSSMALYQNYPSPFNPETWIPYQLDKDVNVIIKIYDQAGRLIRIMDIGNKSAGLYISQDKAVYWDGKNDSGEEVASGVYYYNIQAGDFSATKKTVVKK